MINEKCDFPSGSEKNGRFWQQIPLLGTSQAAEILLPNSSRFALERTYRINPRFPSDVKNLDPKSVPLLWRSRSARFRFVCV